MANTSTLYDLKARALDYADMTSSTFPDEERLTDYINNGLASLHDILSNAYGDYLHKSTDISLVSGTEDYALPTDFYKLQKVFYLDTNRRYRMERFSPDSMDGTATNPSLRGTVQLWYIPQHTSLTSDTDVVSVSVPVGWEDYVCLHAAIRLLQREESDTGPLLAEREGEKQKIIEMAAMRDSGTPGQMGDYYNRFSYGRNMFLINNKDYRYCLSGNNIKILQFMFDGVA